MHNTPAHTAGAASASPIGIGAYRWRICAVLFLATTVNYIDRNVLSFVMLDDGFRHDMLGMPQTQALTATDLAEYKALMGYVDAAFKAAYALGFLLTGWLIDRIGTLKGYAISIGLWSLAAVAQGFSRGLSSLSLSRFALGIGEAGNFPSAIKTVAEWFPRKERSFATGVFNAGANIGIILTALLVPWLTLTHGWSTSFWLTGLIGFGVLYLWLRLYRPPQQHPRLSPAELAYIQQDGEEPNAAQRISWRRLLPYKATWAFALAKFCTDAVWWFYLTWLPDFFNSHAAFDVKLDLKQVGLPFLFIYIVSDLGSIVLGWLASALIARGWQVHRARKFTMLICALCVVPIVFAAMTQSLWVAVLLIALATAAHQGWSANLFTTVSDMFPKHAVASVTGIGGMMGALGGVLLAAAAGRIVGAVGYLPLFVIAAVAYLVALGIIQLLAPKLARVQL